MADPKRVEDMTDEELASMTSDQFATLASGQEVGGTDEGNEEDPDAAAKQAEEEARLAAEEAAAAEAKANEDPDAKENVAVDGIQDGGGDPAPASEGKKAEDAAKPAEPGKAADAKAPVDDKSGEQLAALFAPFKANGREMKVETVEEARQLMSMGANYNKKMAGMKPHLATLRMLENAKIGTEDLNYLIDLHRRDPVAINKLVQESGIDPMDLSAEKAAGYKPGDHRPKAAEVDLDVVLEELKDSEGFNRTMDVVTTKMDAASQTLIAANPGVLKALTANIASGVYDLVQTEVERQRVFGQLTGLSDLEAYRQVGDAMHAAGKFAHLGAGQPQQSQQTTPAVVNAAPDPKKAEDESKRNQARRAVAPVRATPNAGAAKQDFNPLSLSDEEFAKLGG